MTDIRFCCPSCGQEMSCDQQLLGQVVRCPTCQTHIALSKGAEAHASTAGAGVVESSSSETNRRVTVVVSGLIVGVCALVVAGFVVYITRTLGEAKAGGQTSACETRLQWLANGFQACQRFPDRSNWCDVILASGGLASTVGFQTSPEVAFKCNAGARGRRCHYAFNANLSGAAFDTVSGNTVVLFETDGGWNVSGGPELMLKRPRHGKLTVLFADYRVGVFTKAETKGLRWMP